MIYLELDSSGDEEDDVDGDNGGDDGDEWLVPGPVVPGQVATLQLTATKPPHHLVRRLVHQTILVHIYSFLNHNTENIYQVHYSRISMQLQHN